MIQLIRNSNESLNTLGRRFNVSSETIRKVKLGLTWKTVMLFLSFASLAEAQVQVMPWVPPGSAGNMLGSDGVNWFSVGSSDHVTLLAWSDGSGPLSNGVKHPYKIPYGGRIQGWTMSCDPPGSVTVDVLRSPDGQGMPGTSMIGSGTKPSITNGFEAFSRSVSDWESPVIADLDKLTLLVSGSDTVTYVQLTIYYSFQ